MAVHIGTSGWTYAHWQGNFYPLELPRARWLDYYTECFQTVELNASFYRSLRESTFENWYQEDTGGLSLVCQGQPVHHPHPGG